MRLLMCAVPFLAFAIGGFASLDCSVDVAGLYGGVPNERCWRNQPCEASTCELIEGTDDCEGCSVSANANYSMCESDGAENDNCEESPMLDADGNRRFCGSVTEGDAVNGKCPMSECRAHGGTCGHGKNHVNGSMCGESSS